MTVKLTKDYSKFKFLTGVNRPITSKHVADITKSVRLYGCNRPIIVANLLIDKFPGGMYIIDGQHLFTCLCALNLPIPYVVIEELHKSVSTIQVVKAIANFNISSKKWILEDYIRAWSAVDSTFSKIQQMSLYYNIPYVSLVMLADPRIAHRFTACRKIKCGEVSLINTQFDRGSKYCGEILAIANGGNAFTRERVASQFALYFNRKLKEYDHSSTMENAKKHSGMLKTLMNDNDLVVFLESKIFV